MANRRLGQVIAAGGAVMVVVGVFGLATDLGASDDARGHPAARVTTATASRTTTKPEDPQAFFAQYEAAVRTGDSSFLLSRLHPAVIARYGIAQCTQAVAGLADPAVQLRLTGVDGPGAYEYTSDGLSTTVDDTYVFHVDGSAAGRSGPRDYHFARVDGRFRAFLDCGTAQPQTTTR